MAAVDDVTDDVEQTIANELGDDEQPAGAGEPVTDAGDADDQELGAGDRDVDDDDAGEGDDDELHPDERAVTQPVDGEAIVKKLGQRADRYIKGTLELLGPELGGYQVCQSCDPFVPGLVIVEAITDQHRDAVKRQFGIDTLDELQADEEHFVQCSVCRGHGRVKTGSLKHGEEAKDCIACSGFGFRRIGQTQPNQQQQPPEQGGQLVELQPAGAGEPPPTELRPYDEFGTPSWHQDYGKMAHMRTVPVSHWSGNLQPSQ